MNLTPKPSPATAEKRREAILSSVIQLLVKEGAEGVTFAKVAKRAGLGRGAVSYHFKSRERLFRDALDWLVENISRRRNEIWRANAEPRRRLNALFLAQEKLLMDEPELIAAWFAFVVLGRTEKWIAARVQQDYLDRIEKIRFWLKKLAGQGKTGLKLTPGRVAGDLIASIEGMGLLWLNRPDAKGIAAHRRRLAQRWQKALDLSD